MPEVFLNYFRFSYLHWLSFIDRECIIPDISRTYHFGAKGLNMNAFFQDAYFSKHALNTRTGLKFDTSLVKKDNYELHVEKLIQ